MPSIQGEGTYHEVLNAFGLLPCDMRHVLGVEHQGYFWRVEAEPDELNIYCQNHRVARVCEGAASARVVAREKLEALRGGWPC